MEQIKIENLTFAYPTRENNALESINLIVNAGEFVVLCGKSGCGKSTLLRLLKPILAPHGKISGKIIFDSKSINELSTRQQAEKIGFVLQSPDNQIVCDKVWHELAFGLESLSYSGDEIRTRVAEMASFFGIQNWFYKNVSELSGGQKQLLNLAAVMVMQPDVLILDEPTAMLDPIAAHDFLETLSRINKELGTTIIISEHRLEEVFPLADRIAVMESGEIIANGTPNKIGEKLYKTENDMFLAFPTPMKVYYAVRNEFDCPVTVRDGRKWLLNMPVNKDVVFEDATEHTEKKTVLELDDIYFRYEKDLPDVLKGLSFKVFENEIYAIVGGNGAGKTTAFSVISKINTPYRGKIKIAENKRICALPQNPQSLFSRKTILLDLQDVLSDIKESKDIKEQRLDEIIRFCELGNLLDSHPYDLSGGEQQRAALAMVLLKAPDILLLDEPTKGLDMHFKEKLAAMLKSLCSSGITVIMVSHDIEFCAKYADRCGMFFDGHIVSEDTPRKFFFGKSFYTTSANRMARKVIPKAVLCEDIIYALGGKISKAKNQDTSSNMFLPKNISKEEPPKTKKLKKMNIIFGLIFAVLFLVTFCFSNNSANMWKELISIVFLRLACINLIPQKEFGHTEVQIPKEKRKLSKRTLAATLMILFLIPLTIFIGIYYMGDRKYYFISMLIILETFLPFALIFEGRKPKARELIIISVLCALAVAGRTAFAMLPQFKPVVALVIISGICFGGETGFLVGTITGFVSNFFFGQGPWTPWQMFSFGIIGFLAGILFQKGILRKTKTELCIFGFFATIIIYGGIMNPASVLMWQAKPNKAMFISAYAMGLPFDLIHAFSTAFFLWLIAEPMCEKLDRIKIKYGLVK